MCFLYNNKSQHDYRRNEPIPAWVHVKTNAYDDGKLVQNTANDDFVGYTRGAHAAQNDTGQRNGQYTNTAGNREEASERGEQITAQGAKTVCEH